LFPGGDQCGCVFARVMRKGAPVAQQPLARGVGAARQGGYGQQCPGQGVVQAAWEGWHQGLVHPSSSQSHSLVSGD